MMRRLGSYFSRVKGTKAWPKEPVPPMIRIFESCMTPPSKTLPNRGHQDDPNLEMTTFVRSVTGYNSGHESEFFGAFMPPDSIIDRHTDFRHRSWLRHAPGMHGRN